VGEIDSFTLAQEALAEIEGAPADATFRNEDGTWSTLGEIVPLDLFTAVEQLGAEVREQG